MNGGGAPGPGGVHITTVYLPRSGKNKNNNDDNAGNSFGRKVCFYLFPNVNAPLRPWQVSQYSAGYTQHLYHSIHTFQILCNEPKVKHTPKLKSNFGTVLYNNMQRVISN